MKTSIPGIGIGKGLLVGPTLDFSTMTAMGASVLRSIKLQDNVPLSGTPVHSALFSPLDSGIVLDVTSTEEVNSCFMAVKQLRDRMESFEDRQLGFTF